MDIEALIKNLEALNDNLKSAIIRENDDFHDCVKRFQAKLADLARVYNSSNSDRIADQKSIILDIRVILDEIDTFSSHENRVLDFLKDIVPTK